MARYSVRREYLDSGGYTKSGRYFGRGQKLWCVTDEDNGRESYVRAANAKAARFEVTGVAVKSRGRASRAGKSTWSVDAKILEALHMRGSVSPEFVPLFDHLLTLAKHSAKSGYPQRAGREIAQAKKLASKYPRASGDRSRRRRR